MNILFLDQENIIVGNVSKIYSNLIEITGNIPQNTSGFHLVTDDGKVFGKYEDFTTIYQVLEDGYILSNDGSVYDGSINKDYEEYEEILTFEDLVEAKVNAMNSMQKTVIANGVDVTLTDGSVEHFTLSDHDQISLMALQTQVYVGTELIPWHNSNETENCKFYSNEDMKLIISSALSYVVYHVTYFRDLRIYIRSLTTEEELNSVVYGMDIPEEFKSEPLKVMIAAM